MNWYDLLFSKFSQAIYLQVYVKYFYFFLLIKITIWSQMVLLLRNLLRKI